MKLTKEAIWILNDKYQGDKSKDFFRDVKKLEKGVPVDYIIGWKPFLNAHIDLSHKPFIPRPETEYWVGEFIELNKNKKIKVLDLFSGSGCIGIAILKNIKNAQVDFGEINSKFVEQIKINLAGNKILKRSKVRQSNVFEDIRGKYDYILANPPYVPSLRRSGVGVEVLKYEPLRAVFGGKNGLLQIKKLLQGAKDHLNPGGSLWIEFDSPDKREIEKLIKKEACKSFSFHKDQFGKIRYAVITY